MSGTMNSAYIPHTAQRNGQKPLSALGSRTCPEIGSRLFPDRPKV